MSIPSYNRMGSNNQNFNNTAWRKVIIKLKEPENQEHIAKVIKNIRSFYTGDMKDGIKTVNHYDDVETNDLVANILDIIFNVIISITMFLCFFSLCSSMSANLYDQTKEIGILRAMGYTKRRIQFVYFMEAFILVMASCICGLMIGTTVSITMTLQQVMFTQIPFVFYFPWSQFNIVMVMSLVCAFASTYGPTQQLVKNEISNIFRLGG